MGESNLDYQFFSSVTSPGVKKEDNFMYFVNFVNVLIHFVSIAIVAAVPISLY